ncbi:TonB dependent receptor [Microbulbifer aggregans]|uniref:TonB dependent receptor n=1 Tax=Microbulbifer aggregans TaxID=1769779 RepID=A0A1C9WBW2_9GAMM|nr:TonB-dependent receptor [Microbulbifer aggregans]AOS98639.1 TonB dependent receptor [Microbulbifer aggregans]
MLAKQLPFAPAILATSVAAYGLLGAQFAFAQEGAGQIEEVVVQGIRMSQETAVNIKRNATSIVDSIVAEDIGKLPDVTISDSLQRITGVQVRRSAGEGGAINVRGMPQVLTTLNGESYLGAGSVTTVQPNFNDIPAPLFAGADVHKSPTASKLSGGITGMVNLRTHRPMDFDSGVTTSFAAEGQTGRDSGETDSAVSGLFAWNNDKVGVLLSASLANVNLANYYNGMAGGGSDAGWSGMPPEAGTDADNWNYQGNDMNGDGDLDDRYIAYQGHTAYNQFAERERLGLNGSFQADLGNGFDLTADFFLTDMDEKDRRAGIAISDKWQQWGWAAPLVSSEGADGIQTVQVYQADGRRLKSYSEVKGTVSESSNINVELNYDNGGAFTGAARLVHGRAEQNNLNSYMDLDMADGSQWGVQFPVYPGGAMASNPDGYSDPFQSIVVDYRGDAPRWSGVPDLVRNLDGYAVGALSSENNYDREGEMTVARFDGSFDFADGGLVQSVDGGLRYSDRDAKNEQFHLLAPIGDNNCLVRWKATDVVLGGSTCSYGDGSGTFYTAGNPIALSSFGSDVQWVTDFGGATGIPGVYALNPEAMDNVLAFHNSLYPNNQRGIIPGQSYAVNLQETSAYLQANFATEMGVPVSGNFGVRVVQTDLEVGQRVVGASRDYGAPEVDAGEFVSSRSYTDVLPSLNLAFDLRDDLKLRAAYAKTMSPLNLEQWGGGLSPTYAINSSTGVFEVISANSNGNPELDPWRADNFDLSLEYYIGSGVVSAGLFLVDIESFIERGSVAMDLPDQDGVVRRTTDVQTNVQGDGGQLSGLELSAKQAFDFLPGIWSNFGVDVNYTYSPSDSGNVDIEGNDLPFADNSEKLANFVGWYEAGRLQARLAYNYRSERVVAFNQVWGTEGLTLMQAPTTYVDASVSYDVNDDFTVYLNGSNLTGETEEYYLQWKDQKAWQSAYEPRYTLGVRAKF